MSASALTAQLTAVSFRYPRGQELALREISLAVQEGEHLILLGASGSGKSTLLRLVARLVPPLEGEVRVVTTVGLVLQNATAQMVGATVEEDVSFGPLNQGLPAPAAAKRVMESLAAVRAEHLRQDPLESLSRGELQRVAIAGALAMHPGLLLLDEPGAFLDAGDTGWLRDLIAALCNKGVAVVEATHSLLACRPASRVALLHRGRLAALDTPAAVLRNRALLVECGVLPPPGQHRAGKRGSAPVNAHQPVLQLRPPLVPSSLDLGPGHALAVIGQSGSGKSRLALAMAGLDGSSTGPPALAQPRSRGSQASVAVLFQEPEQYFWADTVREELTANGLARDSVAATLASLALAPSYADRRPTELSAGEQRRLALATALAAHPALLVADEPTAGLDIPSQALVTELLRSWLRAGGCLVMATRVRRHLFSLATHCVALHKRRAVYAGPVGACLAQPALLAEAGLLPGDAVLHRDEAVEELPPASPIHLLHQLDPRTKLLALLVALVVLFSTKPIGIVCMALWLTMGWLAAGPRARSGGLIPRSAFLLAFFSIATHALWAPGPYLLQWMAVRVSRLGLWRGVLLALRLLLMASGARLLALSTTPLKLSDALRWLLRPLEQWGWRLPDLPMLLSIGTRFVPELRDDIGRLITLRRLRRQHRQKRGVFHELASSGKELLIPLVRMSLRRAATLGDALALRGYTPHGRTGLARYTPQRRDLVAWAVTLALSLLAIVASR